jgi:hypothetical protein
MSNEENDYTTDKRSDNMIISVLCGVLIVLAILVSACVRGCTHEPVAAYSLCEQCGELIGDADHGRCQAQEVAVCE